MVVQWYARMYYIGIARVYVWIFSQIIDIQCFRWCISVIVLKVSVKVLNLSGKIQINTIQIIVTLHHEIMFNFNTLAL